MSSSVQRSHEKEIVSTSVRHQDAGGVLPHYERPGTRPARPRTPGRGTPEVPLGAAQP